MNIRQISVFAGFFFDHPRREDPMIFSLNRLLTNVQTRRLKKKKKKN